MTIHEMYLGGFLSGVIQNPVTGQLFMLQTRIVFNEEQRKIAIRSAKMYPLNNGFAMGLETINPDAGFVTLDEVPDED